MHVIDRFHCTSIFYSPKTPTNLLLFICLSFLLYDDDQVFIALLLELGHLGFGVLQLDGHFLHLLPRVVDLAETVPQFVCRPS